MTSRHNINQKLQDINEAKKREADARAVLEVAQKQEDANAALDEANKQEADAKKKHAAEAGFITFVVSNGTGLVSKCRIPVDAVAQRGLFRILLGSSVRNVTDITQKKLSSGLAPLIPITYL